jgi:hypothetical protein
MPRPNSNRYFSRGKDTVLQLKSGTAVMVDTEDVAKISRYAWFDNGNGYIASKGKDGKLFLHRVVMDAEDGSVVDHINFNPLDNRKANLRVCRQSQNTLYQRSRLEDKGVYLNRKTGKFYIHLTINGKAAHCGTFDNRNDAVTEYRRLARKVYGEFAYIPTQESSPSRWAKTY